MMTRLPSALASAVLFALRWTPLSRPKNAFLSYSNGQLRYPVSDTRPCFQAFFFAPYSLHRG